MMRLLRLIFGAAIAVHVSAAPSLPDGGSDQWPWGSTQGISKHEFIDRLSKRLTVPELAQHLNLFKYSEIADKNGNASSFARMVGDRGIGEINFWFAFSTARPDRLEVADCLQDTQGFGGIQQNAGASY